MPWPAPSLLHHSLPKGEALQGDLLPYQRIGLCGEPGLDAGCEEPGIWGEREFADRRQTMQTRAPELRISAQLRANSFLTPIPLGGLGQGLGPCSWRTQQRSRPQTLGSVSPSS